MNNLPKYNNEGIQNYLKMNNLKTAEEMYLKYYNLTEAPKCRFCGKKCKFISFFKGYLKICSAKNHYNELAKLALETRFEKRKKYDEFILKNIDIYKNIKFPFIDIYDNKCVKDLHHLKVKSFSKLDILNEERNCIICSKKYIFNYFTNNKEYCNRKQCCSFYHNLVKKNWLDDFKHYINKISISDFIFCKNKKIKIDNFINLLKKYPKKIVLKYFKNKVIFYKNLILERKQINHPYSFITNKIIDNDMLAVCKCCGKKYIKFDKQIKNCQFHLKQVGAEFSCGSKKCYFSCIKYYDFQQNPKLKKEKSLLLKNKILNGDFTPCATNSWTHNRSEMCFDNKKFRSSWELYFYLFNKNKYLEYEKIRIQYFDSIKNKFRIYIVDFNNSDTLYEIKPKCHIIDQNFKDKMKFVKKFCKENHYKFKLINEKWFEKNYNPDILNCLDNNIKKKVHKLLSQFGGKNED